MHRALARAWWVLAAAASLGAALTAAAQTPRPALPAPNGLSAWTASAAPLLTKPQNFNRATEIQVELAWMADPLTCPFYPCARVEGNTLEVGGYVPNAVIRKRALDLARQHCHLQVVDQLKVHSGLTPRSFRLTSEQMQRTAMATLQSFLPEAAGGLQVSCLANGQITVAGNIASLEQKLDVSQRLRRLPGCTSVVNMVQITGTARPGVQSASSSRSGIVQTSAEVPRWTAPDGQGPVLEPRVATTAEHRELSATKPGVVRTADNKISSAPSPWPTEVGNKVPPVHAAAPNGATAAAVSAPAAPRSDFGAGPLPLPNRSSVSASFVANQSGSSANRNTDLPPGKIVSTTPGPAAAPTNIRPVALKTSSTAPPLGAPYIIDGEVTLSGPEPEPAARPAPRPTLSQTQMKLNQRLKEVCGEAGNVQLTFTSANTVTVRFQAGNEAEADRIADRIMELPELNPYRVELEVSLPH